ncbi:MAG: FG-GAP repeat domain-containing protein, partial [Thermoanaerobaculia bacterium]
MERRGGGCLPITVWLCGLFIAEPAGAADCNGNGVDDDRDLRPSRLGFKRVQEFALGDSPYAVTAADLDGDGDLDLATANYGAGADPARTVSVLWNEGGGKFSLPAFLVGGIGPRSVAAADLDGDGDRDLVTANQFTKDLSIHWNEGVRRFAPPMGIAAGDFPDSVAPADLDGDGALDLVVSMDDETAVKLYLNRGRAAWILRQTVPGGRAQTPADLDGDGDLDLIGLAGGVAHVTFNRGNAAFGTPVRVGPSGPYSFALTRDLDRDGDVDLALGGRELAVLFNQGDGKFARAVNYPKEGWLAAADVDRDGDTDLLLAHQRGLDGVELLRNDGLGMFAEAGSVPFSFHGMAFEAADLDGDGFPEIVETDGQHLLAAANLGDGTFGPTYRIGVRYHPHTLAAADLNGDGRMDLAMASYEALSLFLNDGNGTLGDPAHHQVEVHG